MVAELTMWPLYLLALAFLALIAWTAGSEGQR
jgi:hypothetical protein